MPRVIELTDGVHQLQTPTAAALMNLQKLGYSMLRAFTIVALQVGTPEENLARAEAYNVKLAEWIKSDQNGERPELGGETSLQAIADHLSVILTDGGEPMTPDEVAKKLRVELTDQYVASIQALGSEAFGDDPDPESTVTPLDPKTSKRKS